MSVIISVGRQEGTKSTNIQGKTSRSAHPPKTSRPRKTEWPGTGQLRRKKGGYLQSQGTLVKTRRTLTG